MNTYQDVNFSGKNLFLRYFALFLLFKSEVDENISVSIAEMGGLWRVILNETAKHTCHSITQDHLPNSRVGAHQRGRKK